MDPKEKNTYIVVDQKMIQSTTFIQVIQYLTTNIIILKNQLNTFFGLKSVLSDKSYYPDLMLINDSWSIREVYKSKLNNMTINKNNYMIDNKTFFKN